MPATTIPLPLSPPHILRFCYWVHVQLFLPYSLRAIPAHHYIHCMPSAILHNVSNTTIAHFPATWFDSSAYLIFNSATFSSTRFYNKHDDILTTCLQFPYLFSPFYHLPSFPSAYYSCLCASSFFSSSYSAFTLRRSFGTYLLPFLRILLYSVRCLFSTTTVPFPCRKEQVCPLPTTGLDAGFHYSIH